MKKYKTEFKLEVVKNYLAGKGKAKLLARQWSVPEKEIRTWVSHYRLHGIDGSPRQGIGVTRQANATDFFANHLRQSRHLQRVFVFFVQKVRRERHSIAL